MNALARAAWRYDPPDGPAIEVDELSCRWCEAPIGWTLTEVQDSYDSGYERAVWVPFAAWGGQRLDSCEDCTLELENLKVVELVGGA